MTIVRSTPVLGTIITDSVGTIMIDGTIVADFCEVDDGWFHTTRCDENGESIEGDDFTGNENQILEHYSKKERTS